MNLERALESSRVIGVAVGVDEPTRGMPLEAFDLLRIESQNSNHTVRDVSSPTALAERCLDRPTCEWVEDAPCPETVTSSAGEDPVSWIGYVGSVGFWSRCLQNWRSELLAVGLFAMLPASLSNRALRSPNRWVPSTAATAAGG